MKKQKRRPDNRKSADSHAKRPAEKITGYKSKDAIMTYLECTQSIASARMMSMRTCREKTHTG